MSNIGWNSFAYKYYSVNGINYGQAQSDPNKQSPLCQDSSMMCYFYTSVEINRKLLV